MATTLSSKQRLDQLLVARGFFASRSRARDAIARGTVKVAGRVESKAGLAVSADVPISVDDPASVYVSRSALKLVAGLEAFHLGPAGCRCLDLGASTGGFTQVLLERGAASVTAIDVGHGQLHPSIAADPRVRSIEGLNARNLLAEHLPERPTFVAADLSFISLKLAALPALELAEQGAACLLLVKPQFELSPADLGKGGLVRDPAAGRRVAEELRQWLDAQDGWRALGVVPSPLAGGDGNQEYLLAGRKDAKP